MDVIASTFFGTKIDSQNNRNDQFTKHASKAFDLSTFNPAIIVARTFSLNLRFLSDQSHLKSHPLIMMLCLLLSFISLGLATGQETRNPVYQQADSRLFRQKHRGNYQDEDRIQRGKSFNVS